jgi:hypothetical protein
MASAKPESLAAQNNHYGKRPEPFAAIQAARAFFFSLYKNKKKYVFR